MKIIRFEDLDVWKESTSLSVDIYRISEEGRLRRDFGLVDQLRRSAVSIASNIAEGKERKTSAELIRFLYIAKGSAGELRTQLHIAKEIGYLVEDKFLELNQKLEKIGGMIGNLIKTIKVGR